MRTPAPAPLPVLPEMFGQRVPAAPTVAVDGSLGIPPEAMGFDFEEFYDMSREAGYTPDEIRAHTQHFSATDESGAGNYRYRNRTATIHVLTAMRFSRDFVRKTARNKDYMQKRYDGLAIFPDLSPAAVINGVAIHEFGHDHDYAHLGGGRSMWVNALRQLVPLGATTLSFADMIVEASRGPGEQSLIPFLGMLAAAGITHTQTSLRPTRRANEWQAYRFQEQNAHRRIVNIDPAYLPA